MRKSIKWPRLAVLLNCASCTGVNFSTTLHVRQLLSEALDDGRPYLRPLDETLHVAEASCHILGILVQKALSQSGTPAAEQARNHTLQGKRDISKLSDFHLLGALLGSFAGLAAAVQHCIMSNTLQLIFKGRCRFAASRDPDRPD